MLTTSENSCEGSAKVSGKWPNACQWVCGCKTSRWNDDAAWTENLSLGICKMIKARVKVVGKYALSWHNIEKKMQRRALDIATETAIHVIVWCDLVSRKILRPVHDTSLRKKRVTSDHRSLGLPLMHSCTHTFMHKLAYTSRSCSHCDQETFKRVRLN